jgi:hypothetical protein
VSVQRQYFTQSRQNFLKTIGVLLIRNYVWRQVLFGRPKHDTQRQSINYWVLFSPVCISIAEAWFDEWVSSLTIDGLS